MQLQLYVHMHAHMHFSVYACSWVMQLDDCGIVHAAALRSMHVLVQAKCCWRHCHACALVILAHTLLLTCVSHMVLLVCVCGQVILARTYTHTHIHTYTHTVAGVCAPRCASTGGYVSACPGHLDGVHQRAGYPEGPARPCTRQRIPQSA